MLTVLNLTPVISSALPCPAIALALTQGTLTLPKLQYLTFIIAPSPQERTRKALTEATEDPRLRESHHGSQSSRSFFFFPESFAVTTGYHLCGGWGEGAAVNSDPCWVLDSVSG